GERGGQRQHLLGGTRPGAVSGEGRAGRVSRPALPAQRSYGVPHPPDRKGRRTPAAGKVVRIRCDGGDGGIRTRDPLLAFLNQTRWYCGSIPAVPLWAERDESRFEQ